ncbi:MAG TPA: HD domain-containing protein, partial [Deltaproteobacteria bacterium]|nr:HD domain-containing protein [Deltaproteobacteria bacterium]
MTLILYHLTFMHQDQYIAHVAQLMDDLDIISFVIPAPYLYHTCIILSSFLPAQESRVIDQDDTQQESFAVSTVGPKIRIDKNPYAILALGGYGRKEQCLHSDIDVILLFKKGLPREANALVQEIFYPLWDSGFEIGYATRSLKECISLARNDFEILTSLIDARFLCGISSLYSELVTLLRSKVLKKKERKYIDWLIENTERRHAIYGDSTYLLEPNLKEGLGGLRDYHTMLWIARASSQLEKPRDLEFFGYLSHDEYQKLSRAVEFVCDVRNWLHYFTNRKCDQLYFEYQEKMATALNFEKKNNQQPVEVFLGELHRQMDCIKQNFFLLLNNVKSGKRGRKKRKPIGSGITDSFVITEGLLNFSHPEEIPKNPSLLLQIYDQSARSGVLPSNEAKRLVKDFLFLANTEIMGKSFVADAFEEILKSPIGSRILEDMFNTGILPEIIPELAKIKDRIQYDQYHIYPVDKHSLKTVEILQRFLFPGKSSKDKGLYESIASETTRPEILLWAGFLHDIGKGDTAGKHAIRGASMVRKILERLDVGDKKKETVAFLVKEHLLMIKTATRRDLADETTALQCARKIKNAELLKMLFLLTVADSMATGPNALNDWIEMLLKELFFKVHHLLERGELTAPDAVKVLEEKKKEIIEKCSSLDKDELLQLFEQRSPRYLLFTPPGSILEHIDLYRKLGTRPFVMDVKKEENSHVRSITVCARDFPGLFSKIAGSLT